MRLYFSAYANFSEKINMKCISFETLFHKYKKHLDGDVYYKVQVFKTKENSRYYNLQGVYTLEDCIKKFKYLLGVSS